MYSTQAPQHAASHTSQYCTDKTMYDRSIHLLLRHPPRLHHHTAIDYNTTSCPVCSNTLQHTLSKYVDLNRRLFFRVTHTCSSCNLQRGSHLDDTPRLPRPVRVFFLVAQSGNSSPQQPLSILYPFTLIDTHVALRQFFWTPRFITMSSEPSVTSVLYKLGSIPSSTRNEHRHT